jgi:superfamily II DNA helicase RecQ
MRFDNNLRSQRIFFMTPESIVSQTHRIEVLTQHVKIAAIVVDEAHWYEINT